ncbi:hypothetical protein A3B02_00120 [Candidatus Roizmanbacteria bacterium RIFCSPLOWO2_01_FULL_42_14]|uniref:PDZ domain-containing protein n=1 Tax=Candidatus Roizmanbacteria bacterium RIFCSPLOWO2_01_FULL_42_14 TaxID=1802068 RepID=A0A1F7J8W5_9BACT|nr:MAG: hypothetical protein A3B02_00120 [Candidatus Roizmanbacteria bacterium RIFCSPLOWO2_01_FULL_42_14]
MKQVWILLLVLAGVWFYGVSEGYIQKPQLDFLKNIEKSQSNKPLEAKVEIIDEESTVIKAIDKALPSVVTVEISKTTTSPGSIEFDPTNPFNPFLERPGREQKVQRNIGSGFAVDKDLVVTNKHVVADTDATYRIVTNDGKAYAVKSSSRDPLNDLAVLKVDTQNLTPITLGDSSKLKLGQLVIAIGTPLGQFPNTVTTGIISGLGRGITAGSPYEGFVEQLDNVIQTDAAINPGNSGGPLINSKGYVVGVNTAVSAESQNIGFAIPVNVVKELMKNFNSSGGQINRPFIGIRYKMLDKAKAILNDVPEGAYVVEVVKDSPAEKAGILVGDIITHFDGSRLQGNDSKILQSKIAKHTIGDRVKMTIWRDSKQKELTLTLQRFE